MPDTDNRRAVGGSCWAKAEAVSKDCKRIYGARLDSTWLEGKVVKVETRKKTPESTKSTTYVLATLMVGRVEKNVWFPLQSLKKANPVTTTVDRTSVEEGNNGVPPSVATAPDTTTTTTAPATVTPTNASTPVVAVANDREWTEGVVDVDFNGRVPNKMWKMTDQYTDRIFTPGCDGAKKYTAYDYFMAVFPREQLDAMVQLTTSCRPRRTLKRSD